MSHRSTLKTLIFVSLVSLLLAGCSGGSGGADSEHGLVPTPIAETNGTDTNTSTGGSGGGTDTHTAPDTNGTQTDTNGTGGNDMNGTTGGGGNDKNSTGGGTDTNASAGGGHDTNGTVGGKDDNSTGGDTNDTTGGGGNDMNGTTGDSGGNDDNSTGGDTNDTIGGGNDGNSTGGGSNDGNATGGNDTNTTLALSALKLTIADHTLNKDHNTTLTLTATYSDHTTKPLTSGITWIVTPKEAVTLHDTTLTALKDVNATVQAKVGNILSNKVTLNIYWEVNGYRLPPEPDPKINNATLLGVDINKNGVRDDVERWIYTKYKEYKICHKQSEGNYTLPDGSVVPVYNVNAKEICSEPIPYHPVVRAVMMQEARAAQIVIQKPEDAWETTKIFDQAQDCESYLYYLNTKIQNKSLGNGSFSIKELENTQYNTVMRAKAYAKYNFNLSGGVFESPSYREAKKRCNQEVKELLKDFK